MTAQALRSKWAGYVVAVLGIVIVTAVLRLLDNHINATTVALAMLLVVLFVATLWGASPAVFGSVLGMLCFNFFFLPPLGTLTIVAPDNWVALAAFLVTAITAGQLSARVKRRAEEAEAGRREIERLYDELQSAFERASHAEALRQSERLKSALLDAVTHDLRTPLTSIKASVTTLLDELKVKSNDAEPIAFNDEGRREMLEVIDEECDRLNRFIEGLVELARIEAGELRLRRRWGSVDEIITTALDRAEKIASLHEITVELEQDLPVVRVDARAVSEIVYSLVDNAAKYSPAGTPILIAASRAESDMIRMSVEDSGQGIAVELRERVFDKFFRATQAGDTSKNQPHGTGLGLAIARGIVEAHNGRIWIESGADGRGTRVVFTLPIGDDDEADVGTSEIFDKALSTKPS
ncbi:MAG TPA: ATP-binding protein [Blastocatellia bacterium]|nr:ATP-binding protein [Blastocatellia bacterium]